MLKDYPQKDIEIKLVIENKSHKISGLDETDNYDRLKKKIEREIKIPYQFQCLYYKKDMIPLGYEYQSEITVDWPDIKEGRPVGKFVDKTLSIIGNTKYPIQLLNFQAFLEDRVDLSWFRGLSDYELQEFLETFVKRYWPFINLGVLKNTQANIWPSIEYEQDSEISIRNIFSITVNQIKKMKNYSYTLPTESSKKTVTIFDSPQNIIYFFDQFKLTKKYYSIVIKINEAEKYKRFIEGNKLAEYINRVPKLPGILINDSEIYIKPDGTVIHESDDILTVAKDLFKGHIISQKIRSSYNFTVAIPIKMNSKVFSKLLNSYGSFIERDYKNFNFEYFISFYFKKTDTTGDDKNSDYIQSGSFIKIMGHDVLTVLVNNVKDMVEMTNIYNFIIRLFYVYIIEYQYEISLLKNEARIKSNLKDIDWKLFSQENLFHSKHTRLCQREKQPYGFILDSDQYRFFKEDKKNSAIIERQLIMDNLTYPDKKSVYICPNSKYQFPTFISSLIHKNGICIPCCSSIDKRKSPEYQGCIGKNEVEIRDSNNLYYISQFNPEKIMKRKRLSYMPDILHKILNKGIRLKTFISPGENLFILAGFDASIANKTMEIGPLIGDLVKDIVVPTDDKNIFDYYLERGINIVIIRLSGDLDENGNYTKTPNYSLVNIYDNISTLNNIQRNKTIYLLETRMYIYYPIIELILSKDRKYTINYVHTNTSIFTKNMINVLNKIMKIEKTIPYENYSQIKGDIPLICNKIYLEDYDVVLPIIPRSFSNEHMIVEPMNDHVNKLSNIRKVPGLVPKYDLIYKDRFIGHELQDSGLLLFFKPENISESRVEKRQIYIDIDTLSSPEVNKLVDLNMSPELFKVFEMEFAAAINKTVLPNKMPSTLSNWNEILLKKYKSVENPQFILDYIKVKQKDYNNLEVFKKYKDKLLQTSNTDLTEFIENFMKDKISLIDEAQTSYSISNIRKICSQVGPYSVTNQCIGDKLQLTEKSFKKFSEMLAWEITHNEMKKKLILDNILPNIVSFDNFSHQEGTRILKL